MYLFIGIIIGILYGRNAATINQKTYEDVQKAWHLFIATRFAANLYIVADSVYEYLARARQRTVIFNHDLLCTCNRRSCLGYTPSIATYARKIKASN